MPRVRARVGVILVAGELVELALVECGDETGRAGGHLDVDPAGPVHEPDARVGPALLPGPGDPRDLLGGGAERGQCGGQTFGRGRVGRAETAVMIAVPPLVRGRGAAGFPKPRGRGPGDFIRAVSLRVVA